MLTYRHVYYLFMRIIVNGEIVLITLKIYLQRYSKTVYQYGEQLYK